MFSVYTLSCFNFQLTYTKLIDNNKSLLLKIYKICLFKKYLGVKFKEVVVMLYLTLTKTSLITQGNSTPFPVHPIVLVGNLFIDRYIMT